MSNERFFSTISPYDKTSNGVVSLPIRPNQGSQYGSPGLSGKELQARFDKLASVIIAKYNAMAEALSSDVALEYLRLPAGVNLTTEEPNTLSTLLKSLVDARGYLMAIDPETDKAKRLNEVLDSLYSMISDEASTRAEADTKLGKKIDGETSDRIAEDTVLRNSIDEERTERKKDIASEKSQRESADSDLFKRINNEASTRESADTQLSASISSEAAARKSGDDALNTKYNNINQRVTSLDTKVGVIRDDVDGLSTNFLNLKSTVDYFFSTISDGSNDPIDRLSEIVYFLEENRDIIEVLRNDKIDKTSIVTTEDAFEIATDKQVPSAKFIREHFKDLGKDLDFVTDEELNKVLEDYLKTGVAEQDYVNKLYLKDALAPYIKEEEAKKYIDSEELNAALSALDAASSWHFLDTSYSATETNIDSWMNRTDYWTVNKDASKVRVGDLVLFKCYNLTRQTPSYVLAKAIPKDAGNTSGANVIKAYSTSVIHTDQKSTEVEGVDPETKELLDDIYHTNGTVGLMYDIGSKSATLVSVDNYVDEREIEVATIVKGIPVTVISNNVFAAPANAKVEAVIIPHTITAILGNAFANVENLKAVYYIGDVNGWNSIDIGVGNDAVLNANIFFMYDITPTASSVEGVFGANSRAEIPAYFRGLPVRIIGNVKYDASSSEASFKMATNVTEVVIPDTVTELIEYAFYGYSKLRSVRIGSGLKNISKSAFMGTGLLDLALPDGLVGIGASAFRQCSDLQNVFIPKSVTYIGTLAFSECISLSSIRYEGSEEEWNNIEKEADWAGSNVPTILFNQGG